MNLRINIYRTAIIFFIIAATASLAYWFLSRAHNISKNLPENIKQSNAVTNSVNMDTPIADTGKPVVVDSSLAKVRAEVPTLPSIGTNITNANISAERIVKAREVMHTGNMPQKIQALHLLMSAAPAEAAEILRELIIQAKTDASAVALVSHGMVGLSQTKNYLPAEILKTIFTLNDPNAQKIAALILEDRGDASLVKRYIETKSAGLSSKNPSERISALEEIASVGFFNALPYVESSLRDSDPQVKLDALELLSQLGSNSNITNVESLLNDGNADVKQAAQQTIDALWNKNAGEQLSLQERLVQPGFPAQGLVPDLEANRPTENNTSAVDSNPTNEGS